MHGGERISTYWASSQVTIGDRPIFHMRVKKASAVKIRGANRNSYSSRNERRLNGCGLVSGKRALWKQKDSTPFPLASRAPLPTLLLVRALSVMRPHCVSAAPPPVRLHLLRGPWSSWQSVAPDVADSLNGRVFWTADDGEMCGSVSIAMCIVGW